MSRVRRPIQVTEGVSEHPAVRAWAAATSLSTEPKCILVFRERLGGAVYRLPALGLGGGAVFAKRSRVERIAIEQFVYESILPELSLNTPHYYGAVLNGQYGWIFLEDVGTDRYCPDDPKHREVAARWLATMHTRAGRVAAARSLPTAGPDRYLEQLRVGRQRILHSLRARSFKPNEVDILNTVVSICDVVEDRWDRVETACHAAPSTLVHCDFQSKNVFMTRNSTGAGLRPIDWEMAGFGVPAADLTRIDLRSYWSAVRPEWPHVTYEAVEGLASAGQVLQLAAAIDWLSVSLECERPRDRSAAVDDLELSAQRRVEAARSAGVLE